MNFSRLFIKKSVARIQQEGATSTLKRSLGKWNLLSLGIGCIIGAGIFVLTGVAAAEHAGPAITISFILAGVACAFAGLCYAEMASVLPVSGSAYTYAYASLGEIFAWVMGWLLILEYGLASATVSVGWSGYIVSFLTDFGIMIPPEFTAAPGLAILVPEVKQAVFEAAGYAFNADNQLLTASGELVKGVFNLPASIGIFLVTSLLVIGISESAKVNNIIVFTKVLVILAFIVIGSFYVDVENLMPYIPENEGPGKYGFDGVLRAASIIFFAYIGFESISTAAAEAKEPQKDMPFAILGALIICTVLYMLVSTVLTGVTSYTTLNVADPMAVAVDAIGLGWFSFIIKVGAIMGLSSVMLVLVYGQTRIFYTMSRDGLLPDIFCKVHPKYHTPYINTVLVGLCVAAAGGLTPINVLGDLVSLGTLSAFTIVCISVLYLRWKEPNLERPFRVPFAPITPILGIACCGYLIAQMPMEIFETLKYFFFAGLVVYFVYGIRKSRLAREMFPRAGDLEFIKEEHEKRTE